MSSAKHTRTEPKRSRPKMQNYGISTKDEGLIAWDWVDQQMVKSRNYWISSTRPDGRPHAAPVWGVWHDGVLYFSTGRSAVKARNLMANPTVVVHLESGDDSVILEGTVEEVKDKALLTRVADVYGAKYPPFKPDPSDPGGLWYALRPKLALAWQERDFPNTATRWTFGRK
jgi:general stress protein 26